VISEPLPSRHSHKNDITVARGAGFKTLRSSPLEHLKRARAAKPVALSATVDHGVHDLLIVS